MLYDRFNSVRASGRNINGAIVYLDILMSFHREISTLALLSRVRYISQTEIPKFGAKVSESLCCSGGRNYWEQIRGICLVIKSFYSTVAYSLFLQGHISLTDTESTYYTSNCLREMPQPTPNRSRYSSYQRHGLPSPSLTVKLMAG